MTEDQSLNFVFAIGALVLVASALFSRRIGLGQIAKTALAWMAIFAVFLVIFSYRNELQTVWTRVSGEILGSDTQQIVGNTLRIKQSEDGHFWVNAQVNDQDVSFLIDSGATTTALNLQTAERVNAEISDLSLIHI